MVLYDGENIFGYAVRCKMVPNPSALQINEFFGADGRQSLFGGSRGRVFFVEGVLRGDNPGDIGGQIATFETYDDGTARDLVDSYGATWPNILFRGFEQTNDRLIQSPEYYWLPYKALFEGLT